MAGGAIECGPAFSTGRKPSQKEATRQSFGLPTRLIQGSTASLRESSLLWGFSWNRDRLLNETIPPQ